MCLEPLVYGGTGSMSINSDVNSVNKSAHKPAPAVNRADANRVEANAAAPSGQKIDLHSLQQKAWVKEQEINALKVQNRHLISKLEEAEKNFQPGQVYSQQIASEVQNYLKPVIGQIEKSLAQAFELLQGTLRGVYQQSQRAQSSFDDLANHSREFEMKMHEQRKGDQLYFQEKIFSSITAFCDRMERQIETRMSALQVVELMNIKQNEVLSDVESMKSMVLAMNKNSDLNRGEISRIEKEVIETNQRITEIQMQGSSAEEMTRDGLQQIQNHRSEFKILRGEMRAILDQTQRMNDRVTIIDERLLESLGDGQQPNARDQERIRHELKELEAVDSLENLIAIKNEDITKIENEMKANQANQLSENQEDLVMILDLLRSQKTDLKKVAENAKNNLRASVASPVTVSPAAEVESVSLETNQNENNENDSDSAERLLLK
jgi:hypothetical protein